MKALEKRWGTQSWKEYVPALAVFPVWMVGIEGVRRLCGGPRGWIGTLLFGAGSSEGTEALANGAAAMGDGLAAMTPYMADPSLMTGGCLWFTNLAAADPYHILPFALSAILVANMAPRNKIAWRVLLTGEPSPGALPGTVPVQWRLRLQRSLLLVALAVGPMTMDLPAALHLYWLASATISYVSTTVIWRTMPLPKILPPATNERDIAMPKRDPARKH
ncbi:hypothetical protein VTJ04DRAFT_9386 [Mycothermus thermophilus]|uniref:uncharacterized protein n=1 Tax=Humicola insolens TaxID=85995 RepID=UPI0037422B65